MSHLQEAESVIDYIENQEGIDAQNAGFLAIAHILVAAVEQLAAINEKLTPAPVAELKAVTSEPITVNVTCTACEKSKIEPPTNYIELFSDICHGCKEYKKNLISIEGIAICLDCPNVDPCVYVQQNDCRKG